MSQPYQFNNFNHLFVARERNEAHVNSNMFRGTLPVEIPADCPQTPIIKINGSQWPVDGEVYLKNPQEQHSVFIQILGKVQPHCTKCVKRFEWGYERYPDCRRNRELEGGACGNCAFSHKSHECSHNDEFRKLREELEREPTPPPINRPGNRPGTRASTWNKEDRPTTPTQQLQLRRTRDERGDIQPIQFLPDSDEEPKRKKKKVGRKPKGGDTTR